MFLEKQDKVIAASMWSLMVALCLLTACSSEATPDALLSKMATEPVPLPTDAAPAEEPTPTALPDAPTDTPVLNEAADTNTEAADAPATDTIVAAPTATNSEATEPPATDVAVAEPTAAEVTETEASAVPDAVPTAVLEPPAADISLPPGFHIGIYAGNVPNARSMALSPNGTLFVGTRQGGTVYAVVDTNQDYQADEVIPIQQGLKAPNGVAFRDGSLYVAEINRILRFDNVEATLPEMPEPVVINDDYPSDGHHGWKFIRFGPDGRLYVPVGAPCNICEIDGTPYGKITSIAPDGSDLQVYADGVRNSVGFDWHPETSELWFTDNGRDQLGDDAPPDELNRAPEAGMHFGYPYCHGGTIADPDFGSARSCDEFTPPAQQLGPHVASLGMRFYTGQMFPEEYRNQIFIAEHGSWNRSVPIGYRLTVVRLEGSEAVSYDVFAEGWLQDNGQPLGRPVDIQQMPDGSLLVSDDSAGAIYRIWYDGRG